ncbi:MAG: hypothetical protein A2Z83_07795 [Omnitrophica bacterium GWA2_52_8]|nr:MAG: hypothetical protein A2Z83_07795 [Omnitrophica bacterium GWA2_52_8]
MDERMKPYLCDCMIPEDKLAAIARRRFVDGLSTQKLMDEMASALERGSLASIALLDVAVNDLPKLVPDDPGLLMHLYDCRGHVKAVLQEAGIHIEEHALEERNLTQ